MQPHLRLHAAKLTAEEHLDSPEQPLAAFSVRTQHRPRTGIDLLQIERLVTPRCGI
jgi:hypothetical protein